MAAYSDEASLRQRLALSVGMFAHGEVGIGVLLVWLAVFRQQELPRGVQESMALPAVSLALNLALTGLFILFVIKLLKRPGIVRFTNH
jgi:hypothetical protein